MDKRSMAVGAILGVAATLMAITLAKVVLPLVLLVGAVILGVQLTKGKNGKPSA